ncbi:MAG: hypothetical protein ACLFUO_06965 [Candidatus Woesearchaeota archaeon]
MEIKTVISAILKNLVSSLIGAFVGAIIFISYGLNVWMPEQAAELSGLGALFGGMGLVVVTFILFGIMGVLVGIIGGLLVLRILKRLNKDK